MTDLLQAEDLRRRMHAVRGQLSGDVDGLVGGAHRLMDWRQYVKSRPWASLAVSTALGFMLVPRRVEIVSPDAETLEKLARKNRLVVEHKPKAQQKPGLAVSLGSFIGSMILRSATAYVGHQAGKVMGHQAARPENQEAVTS